MNDVTTGPRRVPAVGAVLDLTGAQVRIGATLPKDAEEKIRIRVEQARPEISRWYGGDLVWVHGTPVPDEAGGEQLGVVRQYLVACAAIPDEALTDSPRPPAG